jgi:hypothetical protein
MIAGMGRAGGSGAGSDELEVEQDGSWKALLSAGGERAGRFGGTLDPQALQSLEADVAAAVAAGAPTRQDPWPPGAAVDTFWAGEVVAQLTQDEDPPDPWRPLVSTCRRLLAGAAGSPLAAVEADVAGDGALRQVGSQPVTTDGNGFAVEATLVGPDSATLGSWSTTVAVPEGGELAPGWEAPLGLSSSGLEAADGQTVSVWITFAVVEGLPRPMTLWTST